MSYKCPHCGDYYDFGHQLTSHSEWKHGKKINDAERFKSPAYGYGSTAHVYEREARKERESGGDLLGSLIDVGIGIAIGSMFGDSDSGSSFSSGSDWSGGGGDSGGGGASGDW